MEKRVSSYNPNAGFSAEEAEYYEIFGHANHVSCKLFDSVDVAGRTVFDPGCGGEPTFAREVLLRKGVYIPSDVRYAALEAMGNAVGTGGFLADLTDLAAVPLMAGAYDFTHVRMVLRHLGDRKEEAVREAVRVTGIAAFFLELSWQKLLEQDFHIPLLDAFVGLNMEIMKQLDVDPFMGDSLEDLVRSACPEKEFGFFPGVYGRDQGPYSQELVKLGRMIASQIDNHNTAKRFAQPLRQLSARIEAQPFSFTPPDFHTITVFRL